MNDCDDCERVPLSQIPYSTLIAEMEHFGKLTEDHIIRLEEITREWRETH